MVRVCFCLVWCFFAPVLHLSAQGFKSVESQTGFYSSAPLEDIKASNTAGSALFNLETGAIAFRIPIKEFQFRKKLMQAHFNENFMESEKFPYATFEGKIIDLNRDIKGSQEVTAEGILVIHGVSKRISERGKIHFGSKNLTMESTFHVKLEDFDIKIPKVLFQNIAETVEVTLNFSFQPIE